MSSGIYSPPRGRISFPEQAVIFPALMMSDYLRILALSAALPFYAVVARAQMVASSPAALVPVTGIMDILPEVQVVRFRQNPSAPPRFTFIPEELERLFPEIVLVQPTGKRVDTEQVTALLFAVAKDLREANLHLGEQLEHMMSDKADLERKLHDLEARLQETTARVDLLDAASKPRDSRPSARH